MNVILNAIDSVELTLVFADDAPNITIQVGAPFGVEARFPILG
jgi:hypothetical protein